MTWELMSTKSLPTTLLSRSFWKASGIFASGDALYTGLRFSFALSVACLGMTKGTCLSSRILELGGIVKQSYLGTNGIQVFVYH
jgi:hypothetical protein